ncbi:MAG: cobalamin-binding protein [Chromatiales bacterium]|nr:MAG: cobalamin-binding protein [Chromatiales bacterium]
MTGLLFAVILCGCAPPPPAPGGSGPAQRIVSLAPHLTEMVYAVGAGDRLVGAVEFSDYPAAARELPRVGDAFRVDYEILASLSPDLVLAWRTGNPPALIERLRSLGYRVEEFDPTTLDRLAGQLLRLGEFAGNPDEARRAADNLQRGLDALRVQYRSAPSLRVFYQVAREPLFTVSNRHVIGQMIQLCGGVNVFGDLAQLTPVVGIEAVLEAAPEVILIGSAPVGVAADQADWSQWRALPAARNGEIHAINADLVSRPGPRVLLGADQICQVLAAARANASSVR